MQKLIDSLTLSRDQLTIQIMKADDNGYAQLKDVLCTARDDVDDLLDRVKHDTAFPFCMVRLDAATWQSAGV